ncbi:hypothetical protein E3N88_29566 [Mikania micrantha]|uniref:Uncharacterized protein n=1 Tax=Mikania micrantha TaxID=192012 RepID=A0A5N6MJK3_9ASTR|nr:hypothetical protein E3N88_29566 [Mikania micrantha]
MMQPHKVNIDLIDNGVVYQKDEWVDQRSYDTFGIYKGYLVEKYGEDDSQHPHFDEPLWSRTQSTSCDSSSCGHERQDSEIQRLNKIIEELVKEKESEKAEKEKEKAEKEAMLERMASIESLLRVVTKNLPSSIAAHAYGEVAPAIALTDNALKHLNKIRSEKNEDLCSMVDVKSGGCLGVSHSMEFESHENTILQNDRVVITTNTQFLNGSKINPRTDEAALEQASDELNHDEVAQDIDELMD